MKPEELYRRCDERLLPLLEPVGFTKKQPGEYVRESEEGWDRILVSHGPSAKKRTHFCVGVEFRPSVMKTLDELIDLGGEDEGFLVGPYLNPVSVTQRPKYWGYRTEEALEKSLRHVVECLQNAGLPWLESLRDPQTYAENVDPVAALGAALAWEAAGNLQKAREAYQEMFRRYRGVIEQRGERLLLESSHAKAYVFVTAKLGVDEERRQAFEDKLDYHPDVKPLPK
jgi:hypothetical protein